MIRAVWNGAVLAEAATTVQLEGNDYFPAESLRNEFVKESTTTTVCPWKGTANYYTVTVDGEVNPDAAWYYPNPSSRAQQIANHVAFWKGVRIERDNDSAT
jgi:uncharacterized protein (DUF427 family)